MQKQFFLVVVLGVIAASVSPAKAATSSLGTYIFDIDPVVPTEKGGKLVVDLLTADDPVTNPVATISGFGADSYFIENLDVTGTPGSVKDPITLLPIGTLFGTGPLAPFGPTDNKWQNPLPLSGLSSVHLSGGGFAFQYDPTDTSEAYQVFYKDGQYLGCWQGGSCTTTKISVPVPGPLPLLGVGAAFGFSRNLRKRIKSSKSEVISAIG